MRGFAGGVMGVVRVCLGRGPVLVAVSGRGGRSPPAEQGPAAVQLLSLEPAAVGAGPFPAGPRGRSCAACPSRELAPADGFAGRATRSEAVHMFLGFGTKIPAELLMLSAMTARSDRGTARYLTQRLHVDLRRQASCICRR
ncbi:putative leader peptide [Actinopolyspora saharensis]|uniref:putative leader peptide n=1 Tax=Actinopolyspora saharensis TaxID=995062 RepID=UPI00267C2E74